MIRPDIEKISLQFETLSRPSATNCQKMLDYILYLESHKANDRKHKNKLKYRIKKLQDQKHKLKAQVLDLDSDLWISRYTNFDY